MASIDDLKSKLVSTDGEGYTKELVAMEFIANTVDEAIDDASAYFDTARINLDYDIIEKAKKGIWGFGRRPNKLKIWVSTSSSVSDYNDEAVYDSSSSLSSEHLESRDYSLGVSETSGEFNKEVVEAKRFGITVRKSGIFLNVKPIEQGIEPVSIKEVTTELSNRNIKHYSITQIKKIVQKALGEDVKIASWEPNVDFDSKASLEIAKDGLAVHVTVSTPILSGRVLETEEIYDLLKSEGVVLGILGENIKDIFKKELYNIPILVARGSEPQNGQNARIEYKFKTDSEDFKFAVNDKGNVDYKDLDLLQNVVTGQVLAVKVPATRGKDGRTVLNKPIEAIDGADTSCDAGNNTVLSNNGLEITASIPGRAIIKAGLVCVEPVYQVSGDVSLNTGNIIFLGSVIVKGNITAGFTVKAGGSVEVRGSIYHAEVEADEEVIVSQGILGNEKTSIKAGSNIFAKFIENANIYSGNDVIVKAEILHSNIDAGGRIICSGKKGAIVGGRLRAGYLVSAKTLGSQAYTQTMIEAGVDPKYKAKLISLKEDLVVTEEQLEKVVANLKTLNRRKDAKEINENGIVMLERFTLAKRELELQVEEINEDIVELKNYFAGLENTGKVSVRLSMFPGVHLTIKDAELLVKNDFRNVTMVNKNNLIRPLKYEPFEGEPR